LPKNIEILLENMPILPEISTSEAKVVITPSENVPTKAGIITHPACSEAK